MRNKVAEATRTKVVIAIFLVVLVDAFETRCHVSRGASQESSMWPNALA